MARREEYHFAEVPVDNSVLEAFSLEMSAYYQQDSEKVRTQVFSSYRRKLIWNIKHSLSPRQRQALTLILSGKTERQTAVIMGISQQVVHIHKVRAINKLRDKFKV
jgi:DNA-binding CsgD family transcriptional regulator